MCGLHQCVVGLASRKICCDKCNNTISTAEDKLRASLEHAYASVGATNDERDPFSVTIEFEGREFRLTAGNAEHVVQGSHFERDGKCIVVPLPAGLDNQADKMAKALWRQGSEWTIWTRLRSSSAIQIALPDGPTPSDPDGLFPCSSTATPHTQGIHVIVGEAKLRTVVVVCDQIPSRSIPRSDREASVCFMDSLII